MSNETVLLLGNYRPSLTVARQLAPLGYRLIVSRGGGPEGCAEYSRYISECWDHPPIAKPAEFFAALSAFLETRPDIKIVYPIWEECVLGLALYRDALPRDRIYVTPQADTVLTCLDKTKMMMVAARAGVPVADFAVVRSYGELLREAGRIGFPLVLRPVSSAKPIVGKKALILDSLAEISELLPAWPSQHEELIVQARVTGPRHNLYFAAKDGRPIRYLAAEILRSHLADGTGLAVEGQTIDLEPDLRKYADRILRALDYTGIGCVQFMVDRSKGQVSFLELNPRVAGNHAIAEASGLELSRLAIDLARGGASDERLKIGAAGRRYAWTYGDLRGLAGGVSKLDVTPAAAASWLWKAAITFLRADTHMTWCWSDPKPTLMLFLGLLHHKAPAADEAPQTEEAPGAPSGQIWADGSAEKRAFSSQGVRQSDLVR